MEEILQSISDYISNMLRTAVSSNLLTMFDEVNNRVAVIGTEVSASPSDWNSSVYSLIETISTTVLMPIAGIIITYVMVYELISMVAMKNHGSEFGAEDFVKYFFKMCIAVFIISNTFTIVNAIFDIAQHAVLAATSVISMNTNIDATDVINSIQGELMNLGMTELLQLMVETWIVSFTMKLLSIFITVILYSRMIEIYIYTSMAPIPFATVVNREWGSIGNNYIKGLFALGFQGFAIMICVAVYSVLVNNMTVSSDIHMALFSIMGYTIVLCFSLFHTGTLSKSIFNAH